MSAKRGKLPAANFLLAAVGIAVEAATMNDATKCKPRSARRVVVAAIIAVPVASLGLVSLSASADELDSLNFFLSESLTHDSNLFRLPSGVEPAQLGLPGNSRADTIRTDLAGLKVSKPYGLQRFSANASIANYQFSKFHFLDYVAKNVDGRWDWALTPTLNGAIGVGRQQVLASFADYQTYVRNVRTTDNLRTSAEYGVRGPWHLLGAVEEKKVSDSAPQKQTGSTRTRAAEAGVKYVSAADNSFSYLMRKNEVTWLDRPIDALNQYDNRARQTDHELAVELKSGAKTHGKGSITRVKREHDTMVARNYSGTAGRLEFGWAPTAALSLDLLARREYASWWDSSASYMVTDSLALSPSWQISQKFALRGRVEQSDRDFRGPVQALSGPARSDATRSGLVALDWAPWRSVALSASWQADRRHSNRTGFDYQDHTVGMSAQVKF
jgi:exopolysaccharide biosynthesis operon protein EpsL